MNIHGKFGFVPLCTLTLRCMLLHALFDLLIITKRSAVGREDLIGLCNIDTIKHLFVSVVQHSVEVVDLPLVVVQQCL